ncbi:DNA polymerase-3 subunit delta' [Sphingomonas jinjuensis]|uniref:DNA polymerase-3 subunit delta n=1 Tax=Sphingomonas jinjuensis TaxID=535907 RepID=A0A840FBI7_9SPHN|nr:AAA family ATPase [Sphingomonas jinjuensis]MBB4154041.1 DNA polymerase-3 subunit delta' [Sphingomonas jinjuensis]
MAAVIGHAAAREAFASAIRSGALHHAWLLVGPQGVGKATFARAVAIELLAAGADPARTASLIEAGSHPDYRRLARLPKDAEKPDQDLARSITIAQVRGLQPMFATAPSMGSRRIVVIDAADDLERGGANALLKSLEEPPSGTMFLLVSHAPARLLPTIRSRCRLLRFAALADGEVRAVLREQLPNEDDLEPLVAIADGSPGRALRYAGLDVAKLDAAIEAIIAEGDRDNVRRLALGRSLAGKAASQRYEAFLERAPAIIARAARGRSGPALKAALDAHAAARELSGAALGLSLDPQSTAIEMAGIAATLR